MKHGTVLLLLCAALSSPSSGREEADTLSFDMSERPFSLGISLGVNDFHVLDNYLTPFIYRGSIFSSAASFGYDGGTFRHEIDGSFSSGTIASDQQSRDVSQFVGSVSYAYLHRIQTWEVAERPLAVFLGVGVSSFATKTEIATPAAINWYIKAEAGWYRSHAVDLLARGEYRLGARSRISLEARIPVFGIVSRPDDSHYHTIRNVRVFESFWRAAGGGKGEFVWDNFVSQGKAEYRTSLGDPIDFRCTYYFNYASIDRPLSLGVYKNRFLVGLVWVF